MKKFLVGTGLQQTWGLRRITARRRCDRARSRLVPLPRQLRQVRLLPASRLCSRQPAPDLDLSRCHLRRGPCRGRRRGSPTPGHGHGTASGHLENTSTPLREREISAMALNAFSNGLDDVLTAGRFFVDLTQRLGANRLLYVSWVTHS
jgi:hypothetical protein